MGQQCCKVPHGGDVPTCPSNGQVTKPVGRALVEALIGQEHRAELTPQPYFYCDAPGYKRRGDGAGLPARIRLSPVSKPRLLG